MDMTRILYSSVFAGAHALSTWLLLSCGYGIPAMLTATLMVAEVSFAVAEGIRHIDGDGVDPREPSCVVEAFVVTPRHSLDVTTRVRGMLTSKNGAAGHVAFDELVTVANREGGGAHVSILYRDANAVEHVAVLHGDAYLDTDVEEAPVGEREKTFLDELAGAHIERGGVPLADALAWLRRASGPLGDFHEGLMNEGCWGMTRAAGGDADAKGFCTKARPREVWRYLDVREYLASADFEHDVLVLWVRGDPLRIEKSLRDTLFDGDLELVT